MKQERTPAYIIKATQTKSAPEESKSEVERSVIVNQIELFD